MTKQKRMIATVTATKYRNTSFTGGPSRWVWFTDSEGFERFGHTATDAACGYSVTNFLNRPAEIVYHYTRKGTLIIEFINEIKRKG